MPISAMGRVVDAEGEPVTDRTIVLQAMGANGWTTVQEIDGGRIDVELPGAGRDRSTPVPLRLLDQSTQTPLVISSDPMWRTDDGTIADFGSIRILEAPVVRRGIGDAGENIIGAPVERVTVDDIGERGVPQLREELEESRSELKTVRLELSSALTKVDELSTTLGTPTKLLDVISGLGSQLSITNTELAAQSTPFRLAEVKLDLRGRLGADGSTIVMDGTGDGSGISADLVVDARPPGVPTQGVPSVQGLTASAAARVLRSVGFRMDSATQQLGPDQGVPGQAITQHPAPGATAEFGSAVLVVFGARSESDE